MQRAADKIPENIEFVAAELLAAPADRRPAMLEQIAKALTSRLLVENPGIGIREVSERVTRFVEAVRARLEPLLSIAYLALTGLTTIRLRVTGVSGLGNNGRPSDVRREVGFRKSSDVLGTFERMPQSS